MSSGRLRRPMVKPAITAAIAVVMLGMGVVLPVREGARRGDLVDRIAQDVQRVASAIEAYRDDTGFWPAPAFDLSSGYRGGLADQEFADAAHRAAWSGPYLDTTLGRPTTNSFWSLAANAPTGAEPGSRWLRLHRGFGEVESVVAADVDARADDGDPRTGAVRVTPTWIWFDVGAVSG